eukprot:601241-Lingulodinium_polyedra.AAC.1
MAFLDVADVALRGHAPQAGAAVADNTGRPPIGPLLHDLKIVQIAPLLRDLDPGSRLLRLAGVRGRLRRLGTP